jgi:hypothetical protein
MGLPSIVPTPLPLSLTHVSSIPHFAGWRNGAMILSITTTQQNDIQHNDTQHNDTQHNDTQHNDTQT